jgi:C_GCAxxG_C_C family probable redox protein
VAGAGVGGPMGDPVPGDLDRVEAAVDAFDGGFNCAQAVLSAFGPQYGLPPEMALRIAAPFGGGMGRRGEVCGAVAGALMVLGLKTGTTRGGDREAKEKIYRLTREMAGLFEKRNGSIRCRDLLGCDISTREGLERAKAEGLFQTACRRYVRDAAEILSKFA